MGIPALRRKIPKRGPQQVAGRNSRSLAVPAPPCHHEKAAARKAAEAELLLNLFPNRGEQALPDCSFFPFFFFWPLLRLIAFHFRYSKKRQRATVRDPFLDVPTAYLTRRQKYSLQLDAICKHG